MDELKLGYAREDFSPDKPVNMNSSIVGETVYQPIFATALSFSQGDTRVLIVGVDLRNVYEHFLNIIKPMITEATGVPDEAIYFHSPHNHSSPDISSETRENILDWRERIGFPAILRAVKAAIADEKPVTGMQGGKTMTQYINYVRRYQREDGIWHGIGVRNPDKIPMARHESEADPELRAVRINRAGGKDVILVHFQTHAASALGQMPRTINADFVGPLRDKLEAEEDCLMLYMQGACGNSNYVTRIAAEKETAVVQYEKVGEKMADYAAEALRNAKPLKVGKLQYRCGSFDCTVNHTRDYLAPQIREIAESGEDTKKKEDMFMEIGLAPQHEWYAILRRLKMGETEPMEIAAMSIGDLAMTFAPLEMFHQNGEQLRAASPYKMTFNCGYALNYRGYMPSHECWPHHGYEVFMCHFLPGTGETVVLEHLAQLQDMKKGEN